MTRVIYYKTCLYVYITNIYIHCSFRNNAISIRTGGILPVNACRLAKSPKNDIHQWKELNIEGNTPFII